MERRPENIKTTVEPKGSAESSVRGGSSKTLITVLVIVAAILAAILIYVTVSKGMLVKELKIEKADLTEQIVNLQQDFATLSSDYDSINSQLDSSREEISQLVERIQKTEATNRAKIRQYEKELGTLRSIMRNYIVQIDSLNTLNHKLTVDAAKARRETASVKKANAELQKTVEDLSEKVQTGSIVLGRNIKAVAHNKNSKVVDRSSATVRILTTLTLSENNLAEKGAFRVYVAITDPSGTLLTNSESRTCVLNGEEIATSASREIDYEGNEIDLSIFFNSDAPFSKGIYNVQIMSERSVLGSTQFMLR